MLPDYGDRGVASPAFTRNERLPAWKPLHALASPQVYPRGVQLFRQGVPIEEVLFVEAGIVKLVHTDPDGQEAILDLAFSGAWLGSAAAVAGLPSPVAAATCTRVSLQRIPVQGFADSLERDPDLGRRIRELHARELCRQTGWMAQLSSRTSRERLERIIRQLILALGLTTSSRGIRLQLPLRHWEIARLIAVTPEHLSRLLKQMQGEGVIRREKGWVIIPDVDRLCSACDPDSPRWCERAAELRRLDLNPDCG
jgi:CRP-like cAMP-binding protein